MPFYQRAWNQTLGPQTPLVNHKLRTIPVVESIELIRSGKSYEEALSKESFEPPSPIEISESILVQLRQKLSEQVKVCLSQSGAELMEEHANRLALYTIDKSDAIFKGAYSSIYRCKNALRSTTEVCRIFKPAALIDTKNDLYLRILRHLGHSSLFILGTFDIFVNLAGDLFVFQEHSNVGNAYEYIRSGNIVSEEQMLFWAKDIYAAMDYLGTAGIAHRSIYPKHLLLCRCSDRIIAKLSGFRDAIIYWDPVSNNVIDQPCKPMQLALSFHAPEMFCLSESDDEFYDPVYADIWSYGCTMFFLLSRTYPFLLNDPHLDLVIRNAIAALDCISDGCKYWIYNLMRTNTKERTRFDSISHDEWFQSI